MLECRTHLYICYCIWRRWWYKQTDHGNPPFIGTAIVHITVTDVNDNKPRFLQSNYEKPILENVQPATVLEVSAVDDDEGSNKAIIYSFAKNDKYI